MPIIDALYRASRDIFGGAIGGLVVVWTTGEMNQELLTIVTLAIVFAYAIVLLLWDWLRQKEEHQIGQVN